MKIPYRIALHALAGALLLLSPLRAEETVLRDGDLVAICGDSITDQKIYSVFIQQYLMLCQPASNLQAMQFGVGGEKVSGFPGRLDIEVLPFKPEIVTTCYGMNDGGYKLMTPETMEAFRNGTITVIRKLKAAGTRKILIGSPGAVDTNSSNQRIWSYNPVLAEFGVAAREIAQSEGVIFVDVHNTMMEAMGKAQAKLGKDFVFALDGIHPKPNGHLVMAYAFLKALGVDGNIGTLTVDYAGKTATGTPGQTIKGYTNGVLSVESTRYPFCFTTDKLGEGTLAMTEFFPFNEELNRYRLVVRNAPPRSLVTWGTKDKEFTAAQLAAGINLAVEFPENPFVEPFAEATKAMQNQQQFDGSFLRRHLGAVASLQRDFSEATVTLKSLQELVIAKRGDSRAAVSAAIKPVSHQIKIEPVR